MDNRSKLALYPAYYLARFNKEAYARFGFKTQNETHRYISGILGVKQTTLKQMRDEFDPAFGHRAGWYQKKMIPSRALVADALADSSEYDVYNVVMAILNQKVQDADTIAKLLAVPGSSDRKRASVNFAARLKTGKAAEAYFIEWYHENRYPAHGQLEDTRDLGTGYDFSISNAANTFYVEVKGLFDETGGVGLTGKEWEVAMKKGDRYYLCIVSAIGNEKQVRFYQNPAAKFKPKQQIITIIQSVWGIAHNQLLQVQEDELQQLRKDAGRS